MTNEEFDKLLTASLYRAVELDYADMPSAAELDKIVQPSENFERKMKAVLQNPKKSVKNRQRPIYYKILRTAAAVLITFTVLLGTAMAVSPTVRAAVIDFVRTWFVSPNDIRYGMNIDDVEDMIEEIKGIPEDERTDEDMQALLLLEFYKDTYMSIPTDFGPQEKSYLEWYPFENQVEVDLNGDGIKDKITVTTIWIDEWSQQLTLHINDIELELTLENGFFILNPADGFAIVDIDASDNYLEIAISDYGPSNSERTFFFRYDSEKIIYMGVVEGLYDGTGINYIGISGNGEIASYERALILQTWWFARRYTVDDDYTLVRILEDLYIPVNYDYKYFVIMDILLYTNRDEASPTVLMEKNSIVTISAHDNIEWVQIVMPDGQKGWFKIRDYFTIVSPDGDFYVEDIFFMLSFAG